MRLYSKAVALLAHLALEGRTARRDLAALLWPGASDALNNVSVTRKHLLGEVGDGVLEADTESLALTPRVTCDATQFLADPRTHWALYTGEFLDGLRLREWKRGLGEEFEEWTENWRERFKSLRLDTATELARFELARHNESGAHQWLEIATSSAIDPREDAARLLILLHGRRGASDQAVHVFHRLQRDLDDVLGVPPSAATQRALALARAGHADACQQEMAALVGRAPILAVPQADTPFVGNRMLLERAQRLLRHESSELAFAVVGEAGAGKSRFVHELLSATRNAPIIRVAATASSAGLEVIGALEQITSLTLPDSNSYTSVTALRAHYAALRDALPDDAVVVVEDAHWIEDAPTLGLLSFLLEHPGARRVRVIITSRPTPRISDFIKRLPIVRLALKPLDASDLAQLCTHMRREDVDAAWLRRASGGNPLYALELLRSPVGVVVGVLELIRTRVALRPTFEQQVLESLAVLDGEANLDRLQRVAGSSRAAVSAAVQGLEHEGLVRHTGGAFTLNHDLTRQALLESLEPLRRSLLHLRVARASVGDAGALYYWEARAVWQTRDARIARRAFEALSDRYAAHGELAHALEWSERAVSVSEQPADRVRALLKRAEWQARHSRGEEALATLETCIEPLSTLPHAELHAQAELIRARVLLRERNDPNAARHHLETALLRIAGLRDPRSVTQRGDALLLLGFAAQRLGDVQTAQEQYAAALALRQAQGDQARIAECLNNICALHIAQRQLATAERDLKRVLAIYEGLNDRAGQLNTLVNLVNVAWPQGRLDEAMRFIGTAQIIQAFTLDPTAEARLEEMRGAVLFLQMKYRAALESYERAIAIHKRHAHRIEAELHVNTAETLHRLERLDDALYHVDTALSDLFSRDSSQTALSIYAALVRADVLTDLGDLHGAIGELEGIQRTNTPHLAAFQADAALRLSALNASAVELHALFTQHANHPEYPYHLARALATRFHDEQPARTVLERCPDSYWRRQLLKVSGQLQTSTGTVLHERGGT